jgi:hypothetical protein
LIQTTSSSNYPELKQYFESLARKPDLSKQLEGQYGLTLLSIKQGRLKLYTLEPSLVIREDLATKPDAKGIEQVFEYIYKNYCNH